MAMLKMPLHVCNDGRLGEWRVYGESFNNDCFHSPALIDIVMGACCKRRTIVPTFRLTPVNTEPTARTLHVEYNRVVEQPNK